MPSVDVIRNITVTLDVPAVIGPMALAVTASAVRLIFTARALRPVLTG